LLLSNPFTAVVMTALDGVNGTVCNAQQYQQSLQSYDGRSPSISCLKPDERIGLVVNISLSVSDSELIQFTVGGSSVVPKLHLCHYHIYLDWRMSDFLSRVYPV
jgi:hypothetical protein